MGILAAAGMFLFRDPILDLFNVENKKATFVLLKSIWPILCAMQVINAAVFVLDGLIYAAHAFRFVRNLMIIACVFCVCTTCDCCHIRFILSFFVLYLGGKDSIEQCPRSWSSMAMVCQIASKLERNKL